MGKRAQAEMKSFMLAEKRRLEVIEQFNKCESHEEFSKSLKKYEEKKGKKFFVISSKLTEYHVQRLRKLDEEISQLKTKLKKQFSSPSEHVQLQQISPTKVEIVTSSEQILDELALAQEMQEYLLSRQLNLGDDKIVLVKEMIAGIEISERGYEGSQHSDVTFSSEEDMQESFVAPRTKREREVDLLQVKAQLRALKLKQEELEATYQEKLDKGKQEQADKYQKASKAAKNIYGEISRLAEQYINDGNLDAFKSNSQSMLAEDNDNVKILQEHRGWKLFLTNLLALVCTAGLAQAGYSLYKGQLSWLKPATDAGKKVEDLYTSINTIAVTA
ncbi:hypothetical protein Lsan_2780 [Legionella santicrucis]|uniref:Uncharacterized protein n=1 Tax=Legionella santicrucis TaxID=45074 RepID=A0A0W0YI75_9GAMM|nr:hypothetical protein [Legionella santicrucis]KTD56620.1 hypothetical protein Lsan_2780 [Legionella santicrucis]